MIRAEQILIGHSEFISDVKDACDVVEFKKAKEAMKQITWEGWIALIIIVVGPKADIPLIEKEYREKFNHWYEKEVK